MRHKILFAVLTAIWCVPAIAQEQAVQSHVKVDAATAHFDAVLRQALASLARAKNYAVEVDSKWASAADAQGGQHGSHYRLISQGGHYRVEIQSTAAQTPDLICVNDGAHVTTYYPARKLYSQHAVDSPQATLDENKMLALSLQGSALDILLQHDVAHFVHAQASSIIDRGESIVAGKKAHHFELLCSSFAPPACRSAPISIIR